MTHAIELRHNFEAAHRLPHLGGKCQNLHGHSWWVTVSIGSPALTGRGVICDFASVKQWLRRWVDDNLDHGAMLGEHDPLAGPLIDSGCKVFLFGRDTEIPWPTVEGVAQLIGQQAQTWLETFPDAPHYARVTRVHVTETAVNAAVWEAG